MQIITRNILFSLLLLFIAGCGGAAPETIIVVERVAAEAGNQSQNAFQQAVDLGTIVVGVVDEQVIQPYIAKSPIVPDTYEVGFQPKYVPVRIAVDTEGNILMTHTSTIVTDLGAFDITTSRTVIDRQTNPLLIIQIDDQVVVYDLGPPGSNERFQIDFSDTSEHYRLISFLYEPNGNITLKLETQNYDK